PLRRADAVRCGPDTRTRDPVKRCQSVLGRTDEVNLQDTRTGKIPPVRVSGSPSSVYRPRRDRWEEQDDGKGQKLQSYERQEGRVDVLERDLLGRDALEIERGWPEGRGQVGHLHVHSEKDAKP